MNQVCQLQFVLVLCLGFFGVYKVNACLLLCFFDVEQRNQEQFLRYQRLAL